MKRSEVIDKLKFLIEDHNDTVIEGPDQELDIDSFTMMLIITFIESELGVGVDVDSLDFDSFTTLNKFADLACNELEVA